MNSGVREGLIQPALSGALPSLDFTLPASQEAALPPEARGLRRDQVRLLVSYCHDNSVIHSRFDRLPNYLSPGDVLVINTSATMKAALAVQRANGAWLELHLSTRLSGDRWVIELRLPADQGGGTFYPTAPDEELSLPGGGKAILLSPYRGSSPYNRLWVAGLALPEPLEGYLERHGFPIRYKYVRTTWPIQYYQNVYATEPGSAEMPSAGRAFTSNLITRLVAGGVYIAPLVLHTGVASLEEGEPPYEEYFRLPAASAHLINLARSTGGHVIAVGTTAVRALQTVADDDGYIHAGEGWTDIIISPGTPLTAVDGLLTGLHEPRSSHLSMLLALATPDHIALAYKQALEHGYLWHEFGDLHLILP